MTEVGQWTVIILASIFSSERTARISSDNEALDFNRKSLNNPLLINLKVTAMRRILAIGGGGFTTEKEPSFVDAYVHQLIGKAQPRICFIATPSGDNASQIDRFYAAYGALGFEASNLSFFNGWGSNVIPYTDYTQQILGQDAIFVGGGHLKSALAVWREWGLDLVLTEAWKRGILLAGMSAGAMCWFEVGLGGPFERENYGLQRGLGLIPGACAAHYSNVHVPERRADLLSEMRQGRIPPTLAIDDFAAVLFEEKNLARVVSWGSNSTAYRVQMKDGRVEECALAAVPLCDTLAK